MWLALLGLIALALPRPARSGPEPAPEVAPPAVTAPGASARAGPDAPEEGPAGDGMAVDWRRNYCCGVNCLYVLLKMLGTPVSFERLRSQASVGPQGTNMAELARLARTYGLSLTPMRADRQSIDHWPLPAIVHQRNDLNSMGHYILLLGRDQGQYATLDCTTGQILRQKEGDFLAKWSGYVMLRSRPFGFPPHGWGPYLWVTACLWALGYGAFRWFQTQTRHPARRSPTDPIAIGA